ncbi:MAG: UDP-N-acetylmuramoyl-L-alanine--D-glutamate ligase [Phycisphaerales bacterium]|nr:UDP-N-acetylmuramoyl-L-alanine--D-glutamate ligase [Phycisphaerales bacterium]MCB9858610.1 UDP-N-acetylmuramoyl-L-alanine--D-glutamate ligase [Phycisphaerales bacterium]
MSEFANKRVVVMGLGRFGGGIGVTRWLHRNGADVIVTDAADASALSASLEKIRDIDVTLRLGGHDERDLDGCDLLVASPAVDRRKSAFYRLAIDRGIPVSSEMNLFLERCPARVIGITGSAGKSTTTAMTAAVLEAAAQLPGWKWGRVWLGGNIGKSLLDDLTAMRNEDLVVLELSSFQLENAATLDKRVYVAVVTNVRENHLDRHGTLSDYAAAKANIFARQCADDWLLLPDDGGAENLPGLDVCRSRIRRFGVNWSRREAVVPRAAADDDGRDRVPLDLTLPGAHNLANAAAALSIARLLAVDDATSCRVLNTFAGLVHRLEFVREFAGVRIYNDSKATSPEAAMTSMRSFDAPLVVLLGGSDKGGCHKALGEFVTRRAKAAICYGQTGPAIRDAILATSNETPAGASPGVVASVCTDLNEAVNHARSIVSPGDVLLLSPACASYDQFTNYEQRGDVFKQLVNAWS